MYSTSCAWSASSCDSAATAAVFVTCRAEGDPSSLTELPRRKLSPASMRRSLC